MLRLRLLRTSYAYRRGLKTLVPSQRIEGQSGQLYTIETVLQNRGPHLGQVLAARAGPNRFIIKSIPQDWDFHLELYTQIAGCRNVRSLLDTIPDHRMFVFDHLDDNLLHLAVNQKCTPQTLRMILKSVLTGLAALHERHIVHTDAISSLAHRCLLLTADIKADNIMVQANEASSGLPVKRIEIIDLENAVQLAPGQFLEGAHLGNIMWRSPEANAMGPVSTPSDMFSFGMVCIYTMARLLPLAIDKSSLSLDDDPLAVVIERQISYFADQEGFDGLMQHLKGKDDWIQIFQIIKSWFGKEKPRKPFILWQGMYVEHEEAFKDLVRRLTNFDPARRITAQQALEHEWLKDVSSI